MNLSITSQPDQNPVHFYRSEKVIMCVILIMLSLIGIIGNLMTCLIFIQNKALRTRTNYLVVNLAVADVLQSLNMIFMITTLLSGEWLFGHTVCQLSGWANFSFIVTSIVSIALIGVNRYFKVVKTTSKNIFTKKSTIFMIACSWICPGLYALGPVFGWASYRYLPGKLMCAFQFSDSTSFTLITMSFAVLFPFSTISFTTYKIIQHLKRNSKRVVNSQIPMQLQLRRKREDRISAMLISVILCFVIFYAPGSVLNLVQLGYGSNYSLPYRADAWTVIIAMLNHANNPVIYCILNKKFRKGFKGICSKEKRREIKLTRDTTVASQQSGSRGIFAREMQLVNRDGTELSGFSGISAKELQKLNREKTEQGGSRGTFAKEMQKPNREKTERSSSRGVFVREMQSLNHEGTEQSGFSGTFAKEMQQSNREKTRQSSFRGISANEMQLMNRKVNEQSVSRGISANEMYIHNREVQERSGSRGISVNELYIIHREVQKRSGSRGISVNELYIPNREVKERSGSRAISAREIHMLDREVTEQGGSRGTFSKEMLKPSREVTEQSCLGGISAKELQILDREVTEETGSKRDFAKEMQILHHEQTEQSGTRGTFAKEMQTLSGSRGIFAKEMEKLNCQVTEKSGIESIFGKEMEKLDQKKNEQNGPNGTYPKKMEKLNRNFSDRNLKT